jgi:hypothetical protein
MDVKDVQTRTPVNCVDLAFSSTQQANVKNARLDAANVTQQVHVSLVHRDFTSAAPTA